MFFSKKSVFCPTFLCLCFKIQYFYVTLQIDNCRLKCFAIGLKNNT